MAAIPGWYPDPGGQGLRYWDGTTWTEHAPHAPPAITAPEGNGMAVAALVLGIVGTVLGLIPILFFLGWVLGVLAIVFGALGRRRATTRPGVGRKVMATWGLALGIVAIIAGVIGLVIIGNAVNSTSSRLNQYYNCIQTASTSSDCTQ